MILRTNEERDDFIKFMKQNEISTPFHYIPLHLSDVGASYGYKKGDLPLTEEYSSRLVRLPLYADMTSKEISLVIEKVKEYFDKKN
jgi:dTDP-4-amino-4,6-dideoxygalactose transaminase